MEFRVQVKKIGLILVMFFVTAAFVQAAIPVSERSALIALYNSTNGDSWTNKTGWKAAPLAADGFALSGTEGGWYGITVSSSHVIAIKLYVNNLSGTIPSSIGNFPYLQELGLSSNEISGVLPPELGNLSNLQILSIYGNQLTGTIPTSVGNLSRLYYLHLGGNQLSGSIPSALESLTNLQQLYLMANQLTGEIPAGIGSLSKLTNLHLYANQLSGSIPPELGNLSQLNDLHLSNNQLTGSIPSAIGSLTNLQLLCLMNNQLTGEIPASIGNLSQLTNLQLWANQLSGSIPPELCDLSQLQLLNLDNNQLSGSIPTQIGNLSQLQELHLSNNQLSGALPPELGNLSNLRILSIYFNQLTGTIPTSVGNLSQLYYLHLGGNQLSGSIPSALGSLTNLQNLWLGGNQLSGEIPGSFINLVNLNPYSNFSLRRNALHTSDSALRTFLLTKDPDWESTQTIAPTNLKASPTGSSSITLSWSPIMYTGDAGGYRIYYSTSSGGPYSFFQQTIDKTVTSATVSGLTPGITYFFIMRTKTDSDSHFCAVESESSREVSAATIPSSSPYTVHFVAGFGGSISGTTTQILAHGGDCTAVTAMPDSGYSFTGWSGNFAGKTNPLTITDVTSDMTITAHFVRCTIPTYGLVASFPFNGNANDESGNANNGTVNGATLTIDRNGNANQAYSFDGTNDWIMVADSESVNIYGTSSISLCAWINPSNTSGTKSILNKWGPGGYEDDQYLLRIIDGKIQFAFAAGPTNLYSQTTFQTNQWYFVVAIFDYDQQKVKLYVNGALDNSADFSYSIPDHARYIEIGSVSGGLFFNGKIDDVRIYNRALSGSEISELYSGSVNHTVTFVEGGGGTITGTKIQSVAHGGDATPVTAVPNAGFHFLNWTGGFTGTDNPLILTNVTSDMTIAANFAPDFVTISGMVTFNGDGMAGVHIEGLPGGAPVITDASGNYSVTVEYGWSGTLTPSFNYSMYSSTPASRDYTTVTSNQTEQSYTAAVSGTPLPESERAALIAFYNATDGDNWMLKGGWKDGPLAEDGFAMPGTESHWEGVSVSSGHVVVIILMENGLSGSFTDAMAALCNLPYLVDIELDNNSLAGPFSAGIGNLSNLTHLFLSGNQVSGSIPAEIGDLTSLQVLGLYRNELSGSIPAEIGNLTNLTTLLLNENQLSGAIPAELGNLSNLGGLRLGNNQLSGTIPASLGNLTALSELNLSGNKLSGQIPIEITNLTNLSTGVVTSIGFNALHTSDPTLITFLDGKDPDWASTQTIAPTNVSAATVNSTTVNLTWDPITYTGDAGGYRVLAGTSAGGPYTFVQQTTDKSATSMLVTGLNPGTPYYFVIQTRTDAHADNQNIVDSEYSSEVTATTVPVYTVIFVEGANGTITGTKVQMVVHGSSCTAVTAVPNTGFLFSNWSGDYSGSTNPLTITNVTSDMTITANFAINQYTVTFVAGTGGYLIGTATQTVTHGSSCSAVAAVANANFLFSGWTGGYIGTDNPLIVTTVTGDMTITANFVSTSSLNLTNPNGGEHWTIGTTKSITWTAVNYTGNVRIVLYRSGVKQGDVVSNYPSASGSFSWNVGRLSNGTTMVPGGGYRLYLRAQDGSIIDPSDTWLSLNAPAANLRVTSPNGGENWEIGSQHAITWVATGYSGTVRLILFRNTTKVGQIAANLPAANGAYTWTVGQIQAGTAPAGTLYSIRLQASDGSQEDYSDGPFALSTVGGVVADHTHTEIVEVPSEWLDEARLRQRLLVFTDRADDPIALGLRLMARDDGRLAVATADSGSPFGLALAEVAWRRKGDGFDPQEWRWQAEEEAIRFGATILVLKPSDTAVRTGALEARGYVAALQDLQERLPGVAVVCVTLGTETADPLVAAFNDGVREYTLQVHGVLLDVSDIESWRGGEQALDDEVPVRHAAYQDVDGRPNEENLKRQGAAIWWMLARVTGWPGTSSALPE